MRPGLLILPLAAAGIVAWVVFSGADTALAARAMAWQREAQNAMAGALRALRAGEPGALAALMGLCFAYGLAHAAGPGHGKVLVGGYGLARRVPALRLSAVAMVAALGQAVTAIVLVYAGLSVLGWGRTRMTGLADGALASLSAAAIGAVGLWLVWRGARRLRLSRPDSHPHGPAAETCGCGHRHAPTAAEIDAAARWRDTAALIAGIAIRPCSGAVILLLLTWHMGLVAAGIAGTVAMALGTGAVTAAVAFAAALTRAGTLRAMGAGPALARALPMIEIAAGGLVVLLAWRMLTQSL